jgi:hypothetical protein
VAGQAIGRPWSCQAAALVRGEEGRFCENPLQRLGWWWRHRRRGRDGHGRSRSGRGGACSRRGAGLVEGAGEVADETRRGSGHGELAGGWQRKMVVAGLRRG